MRGWVKRSVPITAKTRATALSHFDGYAFRLNPSYDCHGLDEVFSSRRMGKAQRTHHR